MSKEAWAALKTEYGADKEFDQEAMTFTELQSELGLGRCALQRLVNIWKDDGRVEQVWKMVDHSARPAYRLIEHKAVEPAKVVKVRKAKK